MAHLYVSQSNPLTSLDASQRNTQLTCLRILDDIFSRLMKVWKTHTNKELLHCHHTYCFLVSGAHHLPQWRSRRNPLSINRRPTPLPRSRQPLQTNPPLHQLSRRLRNSRYVTSSKPTHQPSNPTKNKTKLTAPRPSNLRHNDLHSLTS